ncbi:MAG: copper chaperone PCu(A)C [Hyphomicrobiaceae bacterium]|nr:copper chaperone PCu(A)C [Hyphomicrobiaceae bacterium]
MKMFSALVMLALTALAVPASARDITAGDLVISNPWTRVTPPGAKVAGGFLTITNNGKEADRLIGGSAVISHRLEVHEMSMEGGIMKMQEVAGGLEIKPGATVVLKPGSYHVMFLDLKASPVEGTPITGTLKFEKAGEVTIAYDVAPLGAKSSEAGHEGMQHEMKSGADGNMKKMHGGQHGHH